MATGTRDVESELIESVCERVRERVAPEEAPAAEAFVRAYYPTFEQHGWQSPHTAVEIVSDDMPFIVDSVSMELSRREAGIHVLVHPVVGDEAYLHVEIDRRADRLVHV